MSNQENQPTTNQFPPEAIQAIEDMFDLYDDIQDHCDALRQLASLVNLVKQSKTVELSPVITEHLSVLIHYHDRTYEQYDDLAQRADKAFMALAKYRSPEMQRFLGVAK